MIKINYSIILLLFCTLLGSVPLAARSNPLDSADYTSASFLTEGSTIYNAEKAFDGDLTTAWCEGVNGKGNGEWIKVSFNEPDLLDGLLIYPGFHQSEDLFHNNGKPRIIIIETDQGDSWEYPLRFKDYPMEYLPEEEWGPGGSHTLGWSKKSQISTEALYMAPRFLFFPSEVKIKSIRLTMKYIIPGKKWNDTLISEIQLISRHLPFPPKASVIPWLLALDGRMKQAGNPVFLSNLHAPLNLKESNGDFPIGVNITGMKRARLKKDIIEGEGIVYYWNFFVNSYVGKTVVLPVIDKDYHALGTMGYSYVDYESGFSNTEAWKTYFNYLKAFPLITLTLGNSSIWMKHFNLILPNKESLNI